jgi:hypothetical protein
MSEPSKNPNYISSSPSGEDLFEGKSQEKIASTIFDLIKNKALPNNVVGLEGKWGSGKSNVVGILNKKIMNINSDYIFYTYDAWAHQEDLTRRTFLEDLISKLKNKNKFNNEYNWEHELDKLLAIKTRKTTEKFPMVKFYWIFIMASFLLYALLNTIYNDFESYSLLIIKYTLPAMVFTYGLIEMSNAYFDYDKDEATKDWSFRRRIKNLLYVFSGSDLTSKEHEFAIEEEPTVRRFKEYFDKITKDLKSDGLIIVFDNMDRLSSSEKVLSLWSSIHTFFTEEEVHNVWVIIPFDKQHLSNHFDEKDDDSKVDNFIGKTFATTFRISPPVLSDWKKFFSQKFTQAFGEIIQKDDIEEISTLFELIVDINYRKPRDIITFINNLVSLYLQHYDNIDIRYLALYTLRSKDILTNPLIAISGKHFLKEEKYLFRNDKELEESLSAIVYNVEKEKANEILLKNNIEELFIRPNIQTLNNVKKHTDFKVYFDKIIQKSNFSFRPETVSIILEEVKDVIAPKHLKSYWEKFANSLDRRPKEDFQILKNWHKNILKNTSKRTAKMIADQIIYNCKSDLDSDEGKNTYYNTLYELIKYVKSKKINIKLQIDEIEFESRNFIYYVDDMANKFDGECSFNELKIYSDVDKLNEYFINHENGVVDETYEQLNVITNLIEIDGEEYVFNELIEKIEQELDTVAYTEKEKIHKLLEIEKAIYGKNKVQLVKESTGTNFLNHHPNKFDEPYFDIIANQIAHLKTNTPRSQYFTQELNKDENVKNIAQIVQHYITYGDLLKLVVDSNRKYPLLNGIIQELTKNRFGFVQKLNVSWVYENISEIRNELFIDNFEDFLLQFDGWKRHFKKSIKVENVFKLGNNIIDLAADVNYHNFECIKHIYDISIEKFNIATKSEWIESFENESNFTYVFDNFFENNLIEKSITKGNPFMEAYEEYLKGISKRDKSIPNDYESWNKLLSNNYLDNRKLSRLFNDFIDYLLNQNEITEEEINFFSYGLFQYSSNLYSNSRKADEFIRKVIIPLDEKLDFLYDLLADYLEEIIKVINSSSGEYSQDLSELFTSAKNSSSENNAIIKKVFDETKLKEIIEIEKTKE